MLGHWHARYFYFLLSIQAWLSRVKWVNVFLILGTICSQSKKSKKCVIKHSGTKTYLMLALRESRQARKLLSPPDVSIDSPPPSRTLGSTERKWRSVDILQHGSASLSGVFPLRVAERSLLDMTWNTPLPHLSLFGSFCNFHDGFFFSPPLRRLIFVDIFWDGVELDCVDSERSRTN